MESVIMGRECRDVLVKISRYGETNVSAFPSSCIDQLNQWHIISLSGNYAKRLI